MSTMCRSENFEKNTLCVKVVDFLVFLRMIVILLLLGFTKFLYVCIDAILLNSPVDNTGHGIVEDKNRCHGWFLDDDLS